jgi:FkbH-like protein
MFESEVNDVVEQRTELPSDIRERFNESRDRISERTILPWGEHCTECVWPSCYKTCELYSPREDGACRLFSEGMARVENGKGPNPYVLKMKFKSWAKLWTMGNINLYSKEKADFLERMNLLVGGAARKLFLPRSLKARALGKVSYWRKKLAENKPSHDGDPDCFLMEVYNPNEREIQLSFTIRQREAKSKTPYQRLIKLAPGFTREEIGRKEIEKTINLREPFEVEIVPNDSENPCLYFGIMDFVRLKNGIASGPAKAPTVQEDKKCKCIVWDLDNTLWDGVLIEDGPDKIKIRPAVMDVIRKTDERGILHSISSKNNEEDVLAVLTRNQIAEYFLHPQITWGPKSTAIAKIAQLLNIGVDSLMYVDDQEFEREEVRANWPEVMVVDANKASDIPGMKSCDVPVTEESSIRRKMYREQEHRTTALKGYEGDYVKFLKECRIRLSISTLSEKNVERVFELIQRTNQMNFSGNRYPKPEIAKMIGSDKLQTYVMKCEDRFGSYGIVGFAVVDVNEPRLLDLMFSCRVQGKKVEHEFLSSLLREFRKNEGKTFYANYKKTAKNENPGKVFEEIGFMKGSEKDGVTSLKFDAAKGISCYGIVEIIREADE